MTTSRRLRQAPLSCAAAWIPSPGPWRRSGHDPGTSGVPGAARWVCRGLGTGPDRTGAGLGWAWGSGQAALDGEGWGLGSGEAQRSPGSQPQRPRREAQRSSSPHAPLPPSWPHLASAGEKLLQGAGTFSAFLAFQSFVWEFYGILRSEIIFCSSSQVPT